MLHQLDWDDDDEVTLARDRMLPSVEPLDTRIEVLGLPSDGLKGPAEPDTAEGSHDPKRAADGSEDEVTQYQALPPGVQLPPPSCPPRRPSTGGPPPPEEASPEPQTQPVGRAPAEDARVSVNPIVDIDGPAPEGPRPSEDFATIRMSPFEESRHLREAAQGLAGDTLVDFIVPADLRETTVAVQVSIEPDALDESAVTTTEPGSERELGLALTDADDSPPTQPSSEPPAPCPPTPIPRVASDEEPLTARDAVPPPSPPNVDAVLAELNALPLANDRPLLVDLPPREPSDPPPPPRQLGSSLPPVELTEPPHQPAPRRLGGFLALACVTLACIVTAVWWSQPRTGTLTVRLRTPDASPAAKAEIFVNGQKRCDTDPCLVGELPAGTQTVKVIVPGFATPQVAQVAVAAGDDQVLWLDVPSRQVIEVSCPQRSARLLVDGVDRGPFPVPRLDVAPGEHHLRLVAPGHVPWERTIQVAVGAVVEVGEIVLTPATPELTVELTGGRARVVLVSPDGTRRALTGPWPQRLELKRGRYTVLAHRRGHRPFTHHVDLTTERPSQQVEIELERAHPVSLQPPAATADAATDGSSDQGAPDDDPYEG